ncbi:ABC transporter substrate-binding protein [Sporomusa sp.]|uniref:ABC transporter substrate-binding protein n=1 Tax=Sporomusa sp. TaxID=2078658 RepID=UPI002CCF3BD6|nr:ABC transporter substrate-binding protein [Sporomusa sp.]HWR41889.1 ABC transporter substrate-binding protein [Sporomusa sp.]
MLKSKKLIALCVLAMFMLSLAGCGGSAQQEVVIGNLQDLSGPTSVLGKAVTRGAEINVEKINAAGGINGKKIKLVTLDTKGDVQEAIKAFNRLADQEKVSAIVGPPVSNIGLAIAPIANSKKVPVIGSFIDPRVTVGENGQVQPAMFLIQPSSVQYAEIMASYTVEKLGLKKVGILYDQSNSFATSLVAPYKAYVTSVGGQIVSEQVYAKGDKDYKTQLTKIKESGAEAIYVPNYTQDAVITVKQRKQLGIDIPVIGGIDFAPPFSTLVNDPQAATNIYYANNFSDKEPQLTEAKNAYKAKFGEDPINKAYLGFDKIGIIAEAIKKANSSKAEDVMKALNDIKDYQGTTGIITLSPQTHQPVGLSMVMYKINNGVDEEIGRYVPEKHKK